MKGSNLHINGVLFICVHICIIIISLQGSQELLRLSCCSALASSLTENLLPTRILGINTVDPHKTVL